MFESKIFNNIEISFSILAFDLKIKEAIFLPIYEYLTLTSDIKIYLDLFF